MTAPTPPGSGPQQASAPPPAPQGGQIVDDVAAAVLTVDGVIALHGGLFGENATYVPGRRVRGIRIGENATGIHLTATYGAAIPITAQQVRHAVAAVIPGPVNVTVEDLAPPGIDPDAGDQG